MTLRRAILARVVKYITICLLLLTLLLCAISAFLQISLFLNPIPVNIGGPTVSRPTEQDLRTRVPVVSIGSDIRAINGQAVFGNPMGTFVAKFGQPIGIIPYSGGTIEAGEYVFNSPTNTNIYDLHFV